MTRNLRSIRNRLFFVIILTSTIVLLIAGLLFIAFRIVQLKQEMNTSLIMQAGVIADNAQASIVFEDKDEANNILNSLKNDSRVIDALLLNDKKRVLAHYQRPGVNLLIAPWSVDAFLTDEPVFSETEHYLIHARPIYSQGNKIGYVALYVDYSRYWHLLKQSALVVAIVIVIAFFAALFLSYILQKQISEPLESLATFVSTVTEGKNYELRTESHSYAEIEQLAAAFNTLLEQIHHAISARDHAQNQLRKYSLQLQDLVYERTRQLEQAKEAAEASSKAKSAFLANMSHEIRTPMNSIVVFTKLALTASESPHQQRQLIHTLESADLLLALIDDLLDFSRIDANKMALYWQNCDLFEILSSVNQILTVKYVEKRLEFIIDVSETVPRHVQIDSLRIKQILINLLTNAIKFTEKGQVRLTVTAKISNDIAVNDVTFSISDTGIGMDEQTIARIFEVFNQGDVSTTRKYGGTGLGLSISKKLVALMGGELEVRSEPGQGSCFSFSLPLRTKPADDAFNIGDSAVQTPRILVVEPRQHSRQHLHELLQSLKFSVDSLETGERALAQLLQHPYSHLLLSGKLPDIEPFELIRKIKAIPELSDIAISVMDNLLGEQAIMQFSETVTPIGYLMVPVFDRIALQRHFLPPRQETNPLLLPPPRTQPPTLKLSSVLVVDDYNINRTLVIDILRGRIERILEAGTGREALDILRTESVDLVLMDIQMPEMDGFEATRIIRGQLQLTDLPIIGMTAFASEHDREQCLQVGMNDVLIKPIDIDQLMKTVKHFSQRSTKVAAGRDAIKAELLNYRSAGIDIENGLSRLRGDAKNYKKLLILFYRNYKGQESSLENMLEQKNWDAAQAWLHDLKGICANLSIPSMVESCVKLHDQVKNRTFDQASFQQLKCRFASLIKSLQSLAEAVPETPSEQKAVDYPQLGHLLNKLADAIDKQSFSCHRILTDIGTICGGQFSSELDGLERYLQNFQYKQASRILKQWRDEIYEYAKT